VIRLIATFDSRRAVGRAFDASRRAGWRIVSASSPAFDPTLLQLAGATRSPVAMWSVIGGAIGVASGLLLTIGTVRQWPGLIVGGKPLIAMPPFLIIVFELAVLFASIAAIASFLVASGRARRQAGPVSDRRTTDSRFALLVESPDGFTDTIAALESAGAVECRVV
jgi:hypothetical protein